MKFNLEREIVLGCRFEFTLSLEPMPSMSNFYIIGFDQFEFGSFLCLMHTVKILTD